MFSGPAEARNSLISQARLARPPHGLLGQWQERMIPLAEPEKIRVKGRWLAPAQHTIAEDKKKRKCVFILSLKYGINEFMTRVYYLSFIFCVGLCLSSLHVFASTNLVGTVAPTPVLVTFSGSYHMLNKTYYPGAERPQEPRSAVVLNFMSLKCAPCQKELPLFLNIVRPAVESASQNKSHLKFYLVSLDPLSAKSRLRQYMEERKINIETELLLDPYSKAAEKFGVTSIPRTIVISPRGRIVADISGAVDTFERLLRSGIEAALSEKGAE